MTAAYSSVIVDHFRNPRNFGSLESPDIVHEGLNPLCGDRIRFELRLRDCTVEKAGFTGDGCAICLAAASLLTELVCGASIRDGDIIEKETLLQSLECEIKPTRMRCALLPLEVLCAGIRSWRRSPGFSL
jgi:nitrogen fixation NifU-like protein